MEKSRNIYLIWTKNTQYPIYWFTSKYASSMLLAQVLYDFHLRILSVMNTGYIRDTPDQRGKEEVCNKGDQSYFIEL